MPPVGATIDAVTGLIRWIPSRLQVGEGVKFIVAVTDLTLQTVEQTFEVSVVSTVDPPVIVSTAPVHAIAGQGFVYQLDAVDLDPGDVLEYSVAAGPAGASIDPGDGLFTWVPTLEQLGAQTVTVRVTDSAGLAHEQTFVVTVLDSYPPVAGFVVADGESRSFGSTIVSADGSGAANVLLPIEPNQSVYWNATFATGRSIVFELPGDGTELIDRVVLRGDGTNFSAKTFELRITTELAALGSSAPVLTGVLPKDGQAHELAFDATRGGFAKLTCSTMMGAARFDSGTSTCAGRPGLVGSSPCSRVERPSSESPRPRSPRPAGHQLMAPPHDRSRARPGDLPGSRRPDSWHGDAAEEEPCYTMSDFRRILSTSCGPLGDSPEWRVTSGTRGDGLGRRRRSKMLVNADPPGAISRAEPLGAERGRACP